MFSTVVAIIALFGPTPNFFCIGLRAKIKIKGICVNAFAKNCDDRALISSQFCFWNAENLIMLKFWISCGLLVATEKSGRGTQNIPLWYSIYLQCKGCQIPSAMSHVPPLYFQCSIKVNRLLTSMINRGKCQNVPRACKLLLTVRKYCRGAVREM